MATGAAMVVATDACRSGIHSNNAPFAALDRGYALRLALGLIVGLGTAYYYRRLARTHGLQA